MKRSGSIALIAHDAKKPEMLEFVREHLDFFRRQRLVGTGNTARMLRDELALAVEQLVHGPHGGDLMIGGLVAEGRIQAVVFLRDPLTAQPHDPDISALMRVCDVHQVPLATNRATATAVLRWLEESNS